MKKPYYTAYEDRYQAVYKAGADRWGYSPDDTELNAVIFKWVHDNNLSGKRIIEFACGEGAVGMILCNLGCIYHGIDIAPSAIKKAKATLKDYKNAKVTLGDLVNMQVEGLYDAAIDVMGFHMLVTDSDRRKYLKNAYCCLKNGAPMLFYRESYREDAFEGQVDSFDDWLNISKSDYKTPQQRLVKQNGAEIEVNIPLVPGRARTINGYEKEMTENGFIVDQIQLMNPSNQILNSTTIHVHKPKTEPYKGIAAEYDKTRPSYPDELIRDIISKTDLSVYSAILEIGAGTGKATVQFAEKEFAIHAIEIGPEMAEICKNKCALYPKVTIDVASFEEWKNTDETRFDLIFSAQTFHWLEPDIKYEKCHELLKDGGYLALFWYIAHNERSETIREIEQLVDRIMQEYKAGKANGGEISMRPQHKSSVDDAAIRSEIESSGLFRLIDKFDYSSEIRNTAEQYFMSRKSTPAFSSFTDILVKEDILEIDSAIINLVKDCKEEVITNFRFSLYIAQKIDKL